jgi:hypothetical protein
LKSMILNLRLWPPPLCLTVILPLLFLPACFFSGAIRDFLFSFDVISSKLEYIAPLWPGVVGFLLIRLNFKHPQIY